MKMKWRALPGRFRRHSPVERRLFMEAFGWLGLGRLAILGLPFRLIAPVLGRLTATPARPSGNADPALLERIAWAVSCASRYTPWESKCLAQAVAAKMMLRLRGVDSTLFLGLAKDGAAGLSAHAWVSCGERIISGGGGHERFTVVAAFAENQSSGAVRK